MEKNKDILKIKKKAVEKNVSLNSICKKIGIRRDVLSRWENKPPRYYEVIQQLNAELDAIRESA
jgi:hypothetical protein